MKSLLLVKDSHWKVYYINQYTMCLVIGVTTRRKEDMKKINRKCRLKFFFVRGFKKIDLEY